MVKRTQEGKNNKKTKIIKRLDGVRNKKTKKQSGAKSAVLCRQSGVHQVDPLYEAFCHPTAHRSLSLSYETLTFLFRSHFLIPLSLFAFCAETLDTFHLLFRIQIFLSFLLTQQHRMAKNPIFLN